MKGGNRERTRNTGAWTRDTTRTSSSAAPEYSIGCVSDYRGDEGPVFEKGIELIHHGSLPLLTVRIHLIQGPPPLVSSLCFPPRISFPSYHYSRKSASLRNNWRAVIVLPLEHVKPRPSWSLPLPLSCWAAAVSALNPALGWAKSVSNKGSLGVWGRPLTPLRRRRAGDGSHRSQALYELSLLLSTFLTT
jgi:hypothetical protein